MAVKGRITMEYVDQKKARLVCFNSDILTVTKTFKLNPAGMLIGNMSKWTVKDFRSVDKTIYFAPGHVSDEDMNQLIAMYNANLGKPGWRPRDLTFAANGPK